jgi:uncharacterized protein with PIN domain
MTQEPVGVAEGAAEERLRAWRRTHPAANLDEILDVVEGELGQLRQHYLETVLGEESTPAQPATCPRCGGRLEQHGRRRREVLVPHQTAPLRLERAYLVCSSCGASLFPPR